MSIIDDALGYLEDDTVKTPLFMTVGNPENGSLDYPGDTDWVKIELSAGNNYLVRLEGLGTGDGILPDPIVLGIMDSSGTLISGTTVDNGGDVFGGDALSAIFQFAPAYTGTFFIAVGETNNLAGSYTLSVDRDHAGDDLLTGGADADTIIAELGRDTVLGNGGDDLIYGNIGLDSLLGGAGDDTLYGGQNEGTLSGEPLAHRDGIETLDGGSGNDLIYGNHGDDSIWAGADADIVYGGQNDDVILGAGGRDRLYGNLHNDHLDGGGDSDLLWGDKGNDTATGGTGVDGFVISANDGTDVDLIVDFQAGESLIVRAGAIDSVVDNAEGALLTFASGDQVRFAGTTAGDVQTALDMNMTVLDFWLGQ